jgi:hypothetical protein
MRLNMNAHATTEIRELTATELDHVTGASLAAGIWMMQQRVREATERAERAARITHVLR